VLPRRPYLDPLEIRQVPARRTVELEEDVLVDLGEDGKPVGYDIQDASAKRELIGRLVLEEVEATAA
jgi:uncharacterized protein YuzE